MPLLIKGRAVVEDRWTLLRDAAAPADIPADSPVIVPLGLWLSARETLAAHGNVGVWLKPNEDPDALAGDIERLPLIAIDFPKFVDGRGYSSARLLREKYRFAGELRAIGDVLRDQLYYLSQCGFDAFAIRADRDAASAIVSFDDFSDNYQSTSARPVPLFRRRGTASGGDAAVPRGTNAHDA
jgi:uncharacterized protein (DUF934 family)